MKKTAAALLTLFVSGVLLSACADDEDMWGHHHDRDRDRDHHEEHLSAAPGASTGPIAPALATTGR
ncbi:MAG TPA: hypothetical protein VKQ54_02175 [Caulobacteraceae bacterium]|nr:hypothetical protein [Caulobacteraceae bacterium]